jgi:hypothetical protein
LFPYWPVRASAERPATAAGTGEGVPGSVPRVKSSPPGVPRSGIPSCYPARIRNRPRSGTASGVSCSCSPFPLQERSAKLGNAVGNRRLPYPTDAVSPRHSARLSSGAWSCADTVFSSRYPIGSLSGANLTDLQAMRWNSPGPFQKLLPSGKERGRQQEKPCGTDSSEGKLV